MRINFAVPIAVALLGCGSDGGVGVPSSLAEGVWVGVTTGDTQEGTWEWDLEDNSRSISGDGSLSTTNSAVELTISGTYQPPTLALVIQPHGFEDIVFSGTVGSESIKGRLTGAGFLNRTVTRDRR